VIIDLEDLSARPLSVAATGLWSDSAGKNRCPFGVKLRNTQHEQMSSALAPRTDIDLARPKKLVARIECYEMWCT